MSQNDEARLAEWREKNNHFHEQLVKERGEGWQAFWGSQDSQHGRYAVFLRHLPLSGHSILDVGCGFGDFYAYLGDQGVKPSRYLGVDLDPVIAAGAARKYPDAAFQTMDILTADPPFVPDFIVASGIMAVRFDGYADYVLRILKRFHAVCRRGFALNFLSTRSLKPDGVSQYTDPAWVLTLFQDHVDYRVNIIHDYRPNDFTLVHTRSG
jgi:SAM-dependent methyltransferase